MAPALVLDRHHHRGLHPRRPEVRDLADGALPVDVVERSLAALDALRDVVREQWLARADHLALHAAAGGELQRWQRRRVDPVPLDRGVLAGDQALALVERGDDHAVVRDHVGEQLVKAVVDAVDLERLGE